MARSSFCLVISILLFSLVIFASASASDHEYKQPHPEGKEEPLLNKPDYDEVKPEEKVTLLPNKPINCVHPKAAGKVKILPVKPANSYGHPKPEGNQKLPLTKPDYMQPKPEEKQKLLPTKPYHKEPVAKGINNVLPKTIGVQGLVLCKSGLKNFPIPGSVVRITCLGVDEEFHKTTYFTVRSKASDSKGYFYSTISPLASLGNYQWKIKECKAYLDHSPSESCKFSTDVNNGITGHVLSSYSILSHKNIKLYSIGPFFYASEPNYKTPVPNGY